MTPRTLATLLAVALVPALPRAQAPAAAPAAADAPELPYQLFRLENGLTVILHEDHTTPIVGVHVQYDVGSKNEKEGRTGFAHLFEHLMFQGTEHLPKGEADRLVDAAGGSANGSTSQDTTQYWEQVPTSALEQMLFVEADRMGFLLPTLTQDKLDNQRDVVRNERRENYEMQPYGLSYEKILHALWNPEFPYHWMPIGSHEDLEAATLEDVKEFFQRWYGPENAVLAIAGDIDPARTRALVEKWFGGIPGRAKPAAAAPAPAPLASEKRVTMEDRVQLPRLYMAWQSPKLFAEGDAALGVAGQVLSDGKSARLVKRLVMDERIAQSVSAGQSSQALAGMFLVVATPKPGVSLARLEKEIDEEIARLAAEPPTAEEVQRAKNGIEAGAIFSLEPVGGFGGRAATLADYYLRAGDPGYLATDLARFRRLTPEEVSAATRRYLRKDARVVLTVTPSAGAPPVPAPQRPPSPAAPRPGAPAPPTAPPAAAAPPSNANGAVR
ncbi:pitrilysin family protein [Anaeromyxobacter sp. Fw109-5]|uniref:M16 family metallopeptidase n=1 Tax=Anaeromyxobacter sp. (strain Fw109-5) TaxID=404589 RepID=UPI0000ED7AC0|nr:pitrilysin family protein [Anaeromyxobacter sp. Fw109-5]